MAYADINARSGADPKSLGIAFLIHAGVIGAMLLIPATLVIKKSSDHKWDARSYPIDPPKPLPEPVKVEQDTKPVDIAAKTNIDRPKTPVVLPHSDAFAGAESDKPVVLNTVSGDAIHGSGTIIDPGTFPTIKPPAAKPVFTPPTMNSRYAGSFQPSYPGTMRRLEQEGSVRIRVLVGTDGRVLKAERVSATNDDFWQAAARQALSKWRFIPATEGDKKVEAWFTISVKFNMD